MLKKRVPEHQNGSLWILNGVSPVIRIRIHYKNVYGFSDDTEVFESRMQRFNLESAAYQGKQDAMENRPEFYNPATDTYEE